MPPPFGRLQERRDPADPRACVTELDSASDLSCYTVTYICFCFAFESVPLYVFLLRICRLSRYNLYEICVSASDLSRYTVCSFCFGSVPLHTDMIHRLCPHPVSLRSSAQLTQRQPHEEHQTTFVSLLTPTTAISPTSLVRGLNPSCRDKRETLLTIDCSRVGKVEGVESALEPVRAVTDLLHAS